MTRDNWNRNNDDLVLIIRPIRDENGLPVASPLQQRSVAESGTVSREMYQAALGMSNEWENKAKALEPVEPVLRDLVRVADNPRSRFWEQHAAMAAAREVLAELDKAKPK